MTRKPAVDTTADRIRSSILDGRFEAGSRLPPERELAEQLGVSRLTLRSALARLQTEGLVEALHGSGTVVLNYRERGGLDLVGYLAQQALEGGQVPLSLLHDMLELRRMIAVEVVELVTTRANRDEVATIRVQIAKMRDALGDGEAFRAADLAFARLVLRAAHNLALELLFNNVARVVESHHGLLQAFQANAAQTIAVYEKVLELIEEGDAAQTAKVTRRLMSHLDKRTMELVSALAGAQETAEGGSA